MKRNFGVKRLRPPRKTPRNALYMFCPRPKNNFQDFQNQRCIGIFMSQREERREKRDERWEMREKRREKRDERRETRDERWEMRERENKSAGDYISKLPGPKWKIRGLHRKERYSMYLTPLGAVDYILSRWIKIAGENRYIRKICMILVSAVCRPAGHTISNQLEVCRRCVE